MSGLKSHVQSKMNRMADTRPWGFRDYVRSHGFHTIYLVKSIRGRPIKVGVAEDPERRLANLQNANFEELCFHRFWWLPGQAIALRIETSFKRDFARANIRGEWFDLDPAEAVEYIEAAIVGLGTWGLTQSQMEHLQDRWARKHYGMSDAGPSPLRGAEPRRGEPWQRRPRKRREPSLPAFPWEDGTRT